MPDRRCSEGESDQRGVENEGRQEGGHSDEHDRKHRGPISDLPTDWYCRGGENADAGYNSKADDVGLPELLQNKRRLFGKVEVAVIFGGNTERDRDRNEEGNHGFDERERERNDGEQNELPQEQVRCQTEGT